MFQLKTEEMLIKTFRPRDRRRMEDLPPELKFPLFVRDYVAWREPSGAGVCLVFCPPGGVPTGIFFRRSHGDPSPAQMCEWCHSGGGSDQIGLVTADVNSRKRAGITVCLDLSCQDKIEDAANRSGRSALDAKKALMERIGRFATEALGIDLGGAGRD
jgi:FBP C-terminal treble-clef zinc-finger